ncbi:universal stress protein [Psychrosphaera sp. F3M07]|jgi:universal stress protein A|uniref:Universal stress protein n=1 Tax=Psychrosphaera aquimarina TaxID=2044854 RepID=A0ABU3QXN2_9GAMM|nr:MULTISPECIES: universal stress protein [Psychrosphaera]MBU2918950.1 universal stress protein [Psychrosphaera sp. F3M07]MDU0111935.1 universal stress protein [Psychrosphaera aquimarina]
MYKTILCAIEDSEEGASVLAKAKEFAQVCNAKLLVTHIISYSLLPKDYQKELKENALPSIESKAAALDIPLKNVSVKFGKAYEQICLLAEKKNADLIILGTHSKKGIQALIGSTANGVANYAKCDVTLIKV